MNFTQNLDYLRKVSPSTIPSGQADALKDYLAIAESFDYETESLSKLKGFEGDIDLLAKKIQSLSMEKSRPKSGSAKATKARAMKAKKAEASRSAATKKVADKRAVNKPKVEAIEEVPQKRGSSTGKAIKARAMKAQKAEASRSAATKKVADKRAANKPKDKPCDCEEEKKNVAKEVKASATSKAKSSSKATKKVEPKAVVKPIVETKAVTKPTSAPKSTSKPELKAQADSKAVASQKVKLEGLKKEYKEWLGKVENEEKNLETILKLVRPTVKANGLGLSKIQIEIKHYEADISILKKVYARDAKIQKSIMDKAKNALNPTGVKSLAKAIDKAQSLYAQAQGMSGIAQTLKAKPKRKPKKGKSKKSAPKKQKEPKGFFNKLSTLLGL